MLRRLEPAGIACGVIAPAWFLVLYVTAMRMDHLYVFYRDYLSDLGVGRGALAFNAAVIGAGAMTVAFALLGLAPALPRGRASRWGTLALAVGGAFLVCVGVFTEDAGRLHYVVSVGFFTSVPVALLLLTVALWRTLALGRAVAALNTAALALGAGMLLFGFNPRTETVAVMTEVVWGEAVAIVLLLRAMGRWRVPTS